jgi:hypothetical protein
MLCEHGWNIIVPPLTSCVTLGRLFSLSGLEVSVHTAIVKFGVIGKLVCHRLNLANFSYLYFPHEFADSVESFLFTFPNNQNSRNPQI